MRGSGFRIDFSRLKKKLQAKIRLETFKPLLMDFVRKSLTTASKLTPSREYQLIKTAQNRQYNNRINTIPNYHVLQNPSLVVKGNIHWVVWNGKWYNATAWKLPDEVWGMYQSLLTERQRRMQTSRQDFIANRAQARFLYKRSWTECGASIGLVIKVAANVQKSITRRKPAKDPDKGYAQIRGGKKILSVVIFNPFVQEQTAYWINDGAQYLQEAMQQHKSNFDAQVERQLKRVIYRIMHPL